MRGGEKKTVFVITRKASWCQSVILWRDFSIPPSHSWRNFIFLDPYRPSSDIPFKWIFAGWPIVAYFHIEIYHECEGGIENSIQRNGVWHHEACRVLTNDDPEGRIFLSYPHTNNEFFSCSPLFLFIYLFMYYFFLYLFINLFIYLF